MLLYSVQTLIGGAAAAGDDSTISVVSAAVMTTALTTGTRKYTVEKVFFTIQSRISLSILSYNFFVYVFTALKLVVMTTDSVSQTFTLHIYMYLIIKKCGSVFCICNL